MQTQTTVNANAISSETERATQAEQQNATTTQVDFQQSTAYTNQQVASGVQSANNYTNQMFNQAESDIGSLREDMYGGVASALAVAGLPQATENGKSMIAVAGSTYHGQQGYAIGLSTMQGGWIVKAAFTGNSRSDFGAVVGAGFQF